MHRTVKIILNPMADMGNAWRIARDLRSITEQHGSVDWSGTVYPGHAIDLARQAGQQGYGMVIAMGGDGTVHEVINGLMDVPEDRRPVLGVVPAGSGNDFAHALGVPVQSDRALVHALSGEPAPVDLGLMTDQNGKKVYFDNTTGIGFDSVVTIRSHRLPVVRGFMMYLTAVIQTILLNHTPLTMQIETEERSWEQRNLLLTMCNGPREGGGFMMAPDARIDDGILHYAMIENVSRPMMFRLIPEVMKGTHGRFRQVTMGSCRRMSIRADRPMYIHTDGEVYAGFGTDIHSVTFEVQPGALRVVRG